jgi:hypothetical protein
MDVGLLFGYFNVLFSFLKYHYPFLRLSCFPNILNIYKISNVFLVELHFMNNIIYFWRLHVQKQKNRNYE